MKQLPLAVEREFREGNFVIKQSDIKFNPVDPDQAHEWLYMYAIGKKSGEIV